MSECTHDCSTCGESCGERKEANVFGKKPLRPGIGVTAEGAFGVVEVVAEAAVGARPLMQIGVITAVAHCAAGEEFQLSAGGAGHNGHVQRTGHQIGKVAEKPAGLAQLQLVLADELHGRAAAKAVEIGRRRLLSHSLLYGIPRSRGFCKVTGG